MTIYPNVAGLAVSEQLRLLFADAKLRLYKELDPPLSVATVVGDFVQANFSGYAEADIDEWLPPYLDPGGGVTMQAGTKQFTYVPPVGTPVANVIYGWYLLYNGGELLAVGTFPSPISMGAAGDAIPLPVGLNNFRNP